MRSHEMGKGCFREAEGDGIDGRSRLGTWLRLFGFAEDVAGDRGNGRVQREDLDRDGDIPVGGEILGR